MSALITSMRKDVFVVCRWFSAILTVLLLVATLGGLFLPGLYRDTPSMVIQAHGQDLETLLFALPLLIVAQVFVMGGSERALLAWLGVLAFILYTYIIFAFSAVFNQFFLLYVSIVSLSFFTLLLLLRNINIDAIRAHFDERTPTKAVSIYLMVIAVFFFLAWMKDIVGALFSNQVPAVIIQSGIPTNPVYVLDLGFLLPMLVLTSIWLWQRRAWGYVLGAVFLVMAIALALGILSMAFFLYLANEPVDSVLIGVSLTLALVSIPLTIVYLAHLHGEQRRMIAVSMG
jgi:hypothetical protein